MTDKLITADARKMSGADFIDAILGITHEQRAEQRQQDIERCIRAIQRGDTYGWGPFWIAECRPSWLSGKRWANRSLAISPSRSQI
jgi:hypothetical protein